MTPDLTTTQTIGLATAIVGFCLTVFFTTLFCLSSFSAEGRPFDHIPNSVSDKESFGEENDGSASASGRAAVAPYISGLY